MTPTHVCTNSSQGFWWNPQGLYKGSGAVRWLCKPIAARVRDLGEVSTQLTAFTARAGGDGGDVNVGILSPAAFGSAKPRGLETWHCTANRKRVEITKRDYFARETFAFAREEFLVEGALPVPGV